LLVRWFVLSATVILFVTGMAKLTSIGGPVPLLEQIDPVFGVYFRSLFLMVGVVELMIAAVCLLGNCSRLKLGLIGWLGASILLYRIGLWLADYRRPCNCLGIHASFISPEYLKYLASYLLAGSWLLLVAETRKEPSRLLPARAGSLLAMIWLPLTMHAQDAAHPTTYSQVSNMIAFIQGKVPVSRIVHGVSGSYYHLNGFVPRQPLYHEAAYQPDTFYIRCLWQLDAAGKTILSVTNGPIFGTNSSAFWELIISEKRFSVSTNRMAADDPVHNLVRADAKYANIPLKLGFHKFGVEPYAWISASKILLIVTTNASQPFADHKGRTLVGDLQLREDGFIKSISYGFTNINIQGRYQVEYEYAQGDRPAWLPSRFVDETTMSVLPAMVAEPVVYHTNYIVSCTLGRLDLTNGFTPEMFLISPTASRTVAWTNGAGTVTENGKQRTIYPYTAMAHAVPESKALSGWARAIVVCFFVGSFIFFFRLVRRGTADQINAKHNHQL